MKQSVPAESERQQHDSTQRKPTGLSPLSQTFVDNRESTQQMRQMRAAMNHSPQAIAQRKLSEQINNSPRMIAQRQQFAKITGAVQRMEGEEEPMQGQFQPAQRAEDEALLQGKFDPTQRVEEEEPLQGKFDPVQRVKEDELLQGKFEAAQLAEAPAAKQNNTGLPDNLKSGIEHLSGLSMDHVKVHYNSSQPAQLNALAYAQGTDIHVAPGQEKHLPHEAWHVAQQAQGRVKPTMQMAGQHVNDDRGLEREADLMGERASSAGVAQGKSKPIESDPIAKQKPVEKVAQLGRKKELGDDKRFIKLVLPGSGDLHWRTRTEGEKQEMLPIGSPSGQQFWSRLEGDNVEFTIAGPQAAGGASDTGANSIESNIALGIKLVMGAVVEEEVRNKYLPKNIYILIKSHSRNAVAASQIAKGLMVECYKKYDYNRPKIELLMLDPVPGPLHSGELIASNVGIVPQSTVVYSLITQYAAGFAPQKITGAKRMIISNQDHGVGTSSSFKYAGKIYKGSNINSLPEGVFGGVGINNNVEEIRKILSTGELLRTLNTAGAIAQIARIKTIEEVASTFGLVQTRPNKEHPD